MSKSIKGQLVGYIRVSTLEQNTARQTEQLSNFNLDEVFIDYASGKDTQRPQLQSALKHLRKGDTLIVHSMDRLARNLDDLRQIVKDLTSRSIIVQFVKESIVFSGEDSPISNLLLSVMGAFAEFERTLILERQREGIAIAKQRGAYKGRKRVLNQEQIQALIDQDKSNLHHHRTDLAKTYGISRPTLYSYLKST